MTHPIFALILYNNLIEVTTLILSDPEAVNEINSEFYDATPLHYASILGRLQICRVLLQHDASVYSQDRRRYTPLHLSCEKGHHEVARLLLEYHADVNAVNTSFESTPLHRACQFGHLSTAKVLLEHGGSVAAVNKYLQSPLHLAASNGHRDILAWTLEHHQHQFDINMRDGQGWSIIHAAAIKGRSSCCSVILQFQPNIELKTHIGYTALHMACHSGYMKTMRVLLENGAQMSFTKVGNTALHIAAEERHPDIIEMLVLDYHWNVNTVSTLLFHFVCSFEVNHFRLSTLQHLCKIIPFV